MKKMSNFIIGVVVGGVLFSAPYSLASNSNVETLHVVDMGYIVDGVEVQTDLNAYIKDGTSFVPLRFLAETFGYDVDYIGETRTAVFTTKSQDVKEELLAQPTVERQEVGVNEMRISFEPYVVDEKINYTKVKDAIESGDISVDAKDESNGMSLFMRAVKDSNYELTWYLYNKGADLNAQDDEGKTAVHHGVVVNSTVMSVLYLDFEGIDFNVEDNDGKKPIDYTEKYSSNYVSLRVRR